MQKLETLQDLRDIAFSIPNMGMEIRNKKIKDSDEYTYIENRFLFCKVYSIAEGRIIFTFNGKEYMVPYFIEARQILEENGYNETYLQPFFTQDEIPADKYLAKQWKDLEEMVKEYKKPKGFYFLPTSKAQPLSFDLRKKALKIPQDGLRAYHETEGIVDVLPCITNLHNLKRQDYAKLGTYVVLNDIAAVVCVELETYLIRMTLEVKNSLTNLGYKPNPHMKHPLEGIEKFLDPRIQKMFQEL